MGRLARWRTRRDLHRRMRELDRLDRDYGLGALPSARRRTRRGKTRRVVLAVVAGLAAVAVAVVALSVAPGPGGTAFRSFTGINRATRELPPVTGPVTDEPYAFSRTHKDGSPVTYDPCRAIHYVVNHTNAPPDADSFIDPAFASAQAASGLRFIDDGESSDRWASRQHGVKRRPILITFNSVEEVPGLKGSTVGLGGSVSVGSDGQPADYVTGSVALDADWFTGASDEGRHAQEQAIVMHELGHVLGLDHVDDPEELMFHENIGVTSYAAGDRAGLALLGNGDCR